MKLPLLLASIALSGCVSVTHSLVTSKDPAECTPPAVIAADIMVGTLATFGGIIEREPMVSATGGVYLGLSTVLLFAQIGACEWLH